MFIGKSNGRILCRLSKSEILRLYTIVHVAMETMKTSHFTCQSKSFISIFFTCQVSACQPQPFSCHGLANDIYSITDKTVFSHLTLQPNSLYCPVRLQTSNRLSVPSIIWAWVGLMQITMQRARPAWPAKTKLRMTVDCSRIAKEIAMMSGIFVEGKR